MGTLKNTHSASLSVLSHIYCHPFSYLYSLAFHLGLLPFISPLLFLSTFSLTFSSSNYFYCLSFLFLNLPYLNFSCSILPILTFFLLLPQIFISSFLVFIHSRLQSIFNLSFSLLLLYLPFKKILLKLIHLRTLSCFSFSSFAFLFSSLSSHFFLFLYICFFSSFTFLLLFL